MAQKVADQMVETLYEAGIRRLYAVTGDSLNHINEAVRNHGKIQWVHVRHEETGAYAAGAEAQLTGQLACCGGSCGPGHVHLLNGLYDAHRSGAPVIAIASAIPTREAGTCYFQETNTIKLFEDCSYYNEIATTPIQLQRMLQAAIQTAVSRNGVSVIGVPGDVTAEKSEPSSFTSVPFKNNATVCPSMKELAKLAELLNKSSKVTLFCGVGAKDAHKELVELSQLLKAPVAYTFKSKMEIQYDNPNEVGMNGLLGVPSGYYSMNEAEVLLMLGTDFPYADFLPTKNIIVQIDINGERIGRRAKVDMGLCGDIQTTLQALIPLLEVKTDDSFLQKQLKRYKETQHHLSSYVSSHSRRNKIHPEYLMAKVNELAADNAIFTVDTGMTCVWGARYLHATGKRSMLGSFNYGSMANALPQSIGAALACPDRQVVALCGDGGLSMLLGDLQTIVQYKLPIKLIVFNNRALGMVKLEMEVAGIPDWQTDMLNPDFAKVAIAMGMKGWNVSHGGRVEEVLEEAFKIDGPALVNVMTDPNALAMPPKVGWGEVTGFAEAMTKMLMHGNVKEIIETITSNVKHVREVL